jgi:hypothetical protein
LTKIGAPISPINDSNIGTLYTGLPAYSQAASYIETNHPGLYSSLVVKLEAGIILPDVINNIADLASGQNTIARNTLTKLNAGDITTPVLEKMIDDGASIGQLSVMTTKNFTPGEFAAIAELATLSPGRQIIHDFLVKYGTLTTIPEQKPVLLEAMADAVQANKKGLNVVSVLTKFDSSAVSLAQVAKIVDAVAHYNLRTDKVVNLLDGLDSSTIHNTYKAFLNTHIITRIIDGTLDADVVNNYVTKPLVDKLASNSWGFGFIFNLSNMVIPHEQDQNLVNFFSAVANGDIDVANAAILISRVNEGKLLFETFSEMMATPPSNQFIGELVGALNGSKLDSLGADTLITAMIDNPSINQDILIGIFQVLGERTSLADGTIDANTAKAMVDAVSYDPDFTSGNAATMLGLLQNNTMTGEAADNLLKLVNNGDIDNHALVVILNKFNQGYDAQLNAALDLLDGVKVGDSYTHSSDALNGLLNNWPELSNNYTIGKLDLDNAELGLLPDPTEGIIGGLGGLNLEENTPPAA